MSQPPGTKNKLTNAEEAIEFVESLLKKNNNSLEDIEKDIFIGTWNNLKYPEIAGKYSWGYGTLKNTASKLWKKLEEVLKVKVSQKKLKGAVELASKSSRQEQQQPRSPLLPNWQNPQLLYSLAEHQKGVGSVTISPDGKTLASGSWDNTIKLWDLESGKLQRTLTGHLQDVASVIFLDEKTLLSASYDRTIKRWHLDTGELLSSLYNYSTPMESLTMNGHSQWIECFALSPDRQVLASGSYDQTIRLWNIRTGEEIHICRHGEQIISVAFNLDGWILASGSTNGKIKLWDLKQGKLKNTLYSNLEWIVSLAFSPDGKALFSGGKNGKIEKWDLDSGQLIDTLDGHSGAVFSLTFSPDGQTLASGSQDKTIRLWNFHNGGVLQTLEGHSDMVMSVNFSPDAQRLVSGSRDKTIKIWRATANDQKLYSFV
ncbi:MAG: WD40 repeat domain-containing protein [Okeania sp. SIO3B5]|uniref:WD40 repeat domain-containing protein n=1 Tax=Okeania sp. SIO3B5 TaxID=2607811 RepID=UPI0013FF49D0|nr:WD40 repeat domain-containing protein [Okeania sp. SIO3B5]NEO54723.1 WD40 repeat domain-containing protein [Okeania sp. SIO3B5]